MIDQHQISPFNFNAYLTPEVMRILRIWSPKVKFLDILITSPWYFYKKVWAHDRRICSLILGVKGLRQISGLLSNENFLGFQTLGEEYCNIVQVDRSRTRVPSMLVST